MNVYEDTCAVIKECTHCCVANSYGYECSCPTGFSVGQDNKTCESNYDGEIGKRSFISMVRPTVYTNLSRKRSFSIKPQYLKKKPHQP